MYRVGDFFDPRLDRVYSAEEYSLSCAANQTALAAAAWPHTSSVQRYHDADDAAPRGDGGAAAGGYVTRRSRTSARARILRI